MKDSDLSGVVTLINHRVACATVPYADQKVLLALSGGADSVALLHALLSSGRSVIAAHCNFHLRGQESDRDQRFVEDLCRRLKVQLLVRHFDVEEYRQRHGGSMEMACRELRYEWFRSVALAHNCVRILTAHHRDDNIETMLLHMMRSCGLEAMTGMKPDNGWVCRPLLTVSRREITEYLECLGQPYVTDSSNLTTDPDRNFLRLSVIPLLQERWPHAADALAKVQAHLSESAVVYRQQMDVWLSSSPPGKLSAGLLRATEAGGTLLHEFLARHGLKVNRAVEQEILRACVGANRIGQTWTMVSATGQQVWLVREAEYLKIASSSGLPYDIIAEEQPLTTDLMTTIRTNTDQQRAWFPHGPGSYCVRTWQEGDYLYPGGMKGRRKVADLLKEGGIPSPLRCRYLLLARPAPSREVLWIPGLRRSRKELVDAAASTCFCFTTVMAKKDALDERL